eukprot:867001_1
MAPCTSLLFSLFFYNILVSADYIHWKAIENPSLPAESESMICGYDAQTNKTWLIEKWSLTLYEYNNFTSHGTLGGFSSIKTWAQAYTVLDRTLWIIGKVEDVEGEVVVVVKQQ